MSSVFNCKKTTVMGVVVFILFLIQRESFAGEEWQRITQLPFQRWSFSSAVVEDKIYIIGGSLFENFKNGPLGLSTVEMYDSQTNMWRRVADMPTPREAAQAAVVDGIIYVFGGFSMKAGKWEYPVHVEAYNPLTDTWTRKKDMPISRIYFGLGVVAGKIYLIGGSEGFRLDHIKRMDRVDVYDPATDTWAKGPPKMPTGREYIRVEVVNNRIYVIGGSGWPPVPPPIGWDPLLTVIEECDPRTRQWRQKRGMLDIRQTFSTVVVKDEIYLIGGWAHRKDLATVDVYHPQKESWRNIPALPMSLSTNSPSGAATVNGKIYLFGGSKEGVEFFPDVLVYDTGFRAVEATGKLSTRWGKLKAKHPLPTKEADNR